MRGHVRVWGEFCCSAPQYGRGHGGETRDTQEHTHTHTGTYTQMLHLPFSDLPLKKCPTIAWELRNFYHHHPERKKRKSSEANSGSIHPYGRYENAVKTRKTISTIAILWPVKAIFEKRAATAEVDTLISPDCSAKTKRGRRKGDGKKVLRHFSTMCDIYNNFRLFVPLT